MLPILHCIVPAKTTRRDADPLARLLGAGERTGIDVPEEGDEGIRDLMRCREKAAVNAPHSKRFAKIEGTGSARQRLECGSFSTAIGSGGEAVKRKPQGSWRTATGETASGKGHGN